MAETRVPDEKVVESLADALFEAYTSLAELEPKLHSPLVFSVPAPFEDVFVAVMQANRLLDKMGTASFFPSGVQKTYILINNCLNIPDK